MGTVWNLWTTCPPHPHIPTPFGAVSALNQVLEVSTDGVDVSPSGLAPVISEVVRPFVDQGGAAYNYHPTDEELAAAAAEARRADVSDCRRRCSRSWYP